MNNKKKLWCHSDSVNGKWHGGYEEKWEAKEYGEEWAREDGDHYFYIAWFYEGDEDVREVEKVTLNENTNN